MTKITYPTAQILSYCSQILGKNIFDHELVADDEGLKIKLSSCTTMNEVITVLQEGNEKKFGRKKILPGGSYLYWKHAGENAKPLPPTPHIKKKKKAPAHASKSLVAQHLLRTYGSYNTPSKTQIEEYNKMDAVRKMLADPDPNFHEPE